MKNNKFTISPIHVGLVSLLLLLLILAAVALNRSALDDWTPPPELAGHWAGESEVFATFKQGESPSQYAEDWVDIEIVIKPDGSVTGHAGQAELTGCRVKQNRNDFERIVGIKADYIISGTLEGGTAADDEISHRDISIPFNLRDGQLKGSLFHNEAWKYPDPVFPYLVLERVEE